MLALALGGRTIAEWQQVMSSEEFVDWQLFYEMNPFGSYRGDIQAGIIAATIANVNSQKGKRFQPSDFMPRFRPAQGAEDRMSNEQIRAFVSDLATKKGHA